MHRVKRGQAYTVILLGFFLQLVISDLLRSGTVKPNILIIVTAFFALFSSGKFGAETGFFCGLLLDIFSIRLFGLNAMLFAAGGYIIGKSNTKFYRDSMITHFILTFTLSFIVLSAYFIIVSARGPSVSHWAGSRLLFNSPVVLISLLNSFLAIWIFAFLTRVLGLSETAL
ncbi:MAG: rod shape-determining protein MreD [Candidatus Omnitrophica bacterium]|nr:rod shape-determining protein MreD [Candidatus Omnitrophota bacterium]